jgi:galactitol PTS system EIIA component
LVCKGGENLKSLTINEHNILIDIEAKNKEEVLSIMAKNLMDHGYVKESFLNAIIKREEKFPTGLPTGGVKVAIPHTDVEHINNKTISVGLLKQPVEFSMMGGSDETVQVKLVFMLAMDEAHSQIELLQSLMAILQNKETLEVLVSQKNKETIANILNNELSKSEETNSAAS